MKVLFTDIICNIAELFHKSAALNYILPIIIFFFTFSALGQGSFTKDQIEEFKKKYKSLDFIYLKKDLEIIPYKSDTDDFRLKLNFSEVILILSPKGSESFLDQTIEYSDAIQLHGAKSKLRSESGKTQKAILSSEVQTISSNFVFYDGEKSRELNFEDVAVGDIIETSYSLIYENGALPIRHFFGGFAPIVSSNVELQEPDWVEFDKQFYNDKGMITESKKQHGNVTYSVFTFTGTPYTHVFEPDAPSFLSLVPHIIFQVKECNINDKQFGLPDLSALQKIYLSYLDNVISDTSFSDLRTITLEITKELNSDSEKVKAIYYWVQNHIQYVAFEEGISGVRPRLGKNTFNKRYGDCKDMAVLIYGMAKSIGIRIQIAWTGTRDLPYTYEKSHNQFVDNHMIATFQDNDRKYFLDATSDFQPFDLPTSFIQGKEALIFDDKSNSFLVERIPVIGSLMNCIKDSTILTIADDFVVGSKKKEVGGYNKIAYFHLFNEPDLLEKNKRKLTGYFFNNENVSRKVDFVRVKVNERDSISKVELVFREKLSKLDSNTVLLNVFTGNLPLDQLKLKNRKLPLEIDYKTTSVSLTKVIIPSDYSVTKLPENKVIDKDGISYQINYEFFNGELKQLVIVELTKLNYSIEEVEVLEKTISELTKQLSKPLVLIRK